LTDVGSFLWLGSVGWRGRNTSSLDCRVARSRTFRCSCAAVCAISKKLPHAVEPVGNVNLGHIYWSVLPVSVHNCREHMLQGWAKLHSFLAGREGDRGIGVYIREGIVHYQPRLSVMLRDHPQGGDA
jgi:hypothetical protein